jgi:SAM-dependent methyltransferase
MLRRLLKPLIPARHRARVRAAAQRWGARLRHTGWARYCPVCRSPVRAFLAAGIRGRLDARCPVCGAVERHRLIWLFMRQRTQLFDGRPTAFLHVAPEKLQADRLRRLAGVRYVSVDLMSPRATVRSDLISLAFTDGAFDSVYCSHVLEHIPDDRRALAEIFRVTRPGGWAILQVPVVGDTTIEDHSVIDPAERERHFGQRDHVRIYGLDFIQRAESAGFNITAERFARSLPPRQARSLGLDLDETVFFARRPGSR